MGGLATRPVHEHGRFVLRQLVLPMHEAAMCVRRMRTPMFRLGREQLVCGRGQAVARPGFMRAPWGAELGARVGPAEQGCRNRSHASASGPGTTCTLLSAPAQLARRPAAV